MRKLLWGLPFLLAGLACSSLATAEDADVRALQAQMAAMQAQMTNQADELRDMRAKMAYQKGMDAGAAEGVVSIKKNAKITIGGFMNTRYYSHNAKIKSKLANTAAATGSVQGLPSGGTQLENTGVMRTREQFKYGDYTMADAKLDIAFQLTENIDGFIRMDLHDSYRSRGLSGIAENWWIRWKNICNTGFGIKVGIDEVVFGAPQEFGNLDNWSRDPWTMTTNAAGNSQYIWASTPGNGGYSTMGDGMFSNGTMLPTHTANKMLHTTQATMFWESADEKFLAEASLMQGVDRWGAIGDYNENDDRWNSGSSDVDRWRSVNYGLGSGSVRLTWKPIEGLRLQASAMNRYTGSDRGNWVMRGYDRQENWAAGQTTAQKMVYYGVETTSNNPATNLAFRWDPCFAPKLTFWGTWTHGWNENWVKDLDSDTATVGMAWRFMPRFYWMASGEYIRAKNKQSDVWNKATGWNFWTAIHYDFDYGVSLELGWRHEAIDYKGRGGTEFAGTHTKYRQNLFYGHFGFSF